MIDTTDPSRHRAPFLERAVLLARRAASAAGMLFVLGAAGSVGADEIQRVGDTFGPIFGEHAAIALSPDGAHLYFNISGLGGPDLPGYSPRDPATGDLTALRAYSALTDALTFLTVSPDAAFVYATDTAGRLHTFSRFAGNGDLTLIDTIAGSYGGHLIVTPDARDLYVLSEAIDELALFRVDPSTGLLTANGSVAIPLANTPLDGGSSDLVASPDGEHVYVVTSLNELRSFDRDPATGGLALVDTEASGGLHLVISPDGRHLYVAASTTIDVFLRDTVGGTLASWGSHLGGLPSEIQDVEITPDGSRVITYGEGSIAVMARDSLTGLLGLTPLDYRLSPTARVAGELLMSRDGRHLYVWSDESRDPLDQRLEQFSLRRVAFVEALFDGVDGVEGLFGANGVDVSPDGRHVYAVGDNGDALSVFSRDPAADGALDFVESHVDGAAGVDGLDFPFDVVVSPDGAHVYVAAALDHGIGIFSRDALTGELSYESALIQSNVDSLAFVEGLVVSPDGEHVYAVGKDTLALDRDPATGLLSVVNSVPGSGLNHLTISPDGKTVYTVSSHSSIGGGIDRLDVMERDASTGALSLRESFVDGAGVDGLDGARDVAVSPNGEFVLVAGRDDDALAVFSREPATGLLTFSRVFRHETLSSPQGLSISPSGETVAVAGGAADELTLLSFDQDFGVLRPVQRESNGEAGVHGLDHPVDLTWTPDGQNLYVVARTDSAVSTYVPEPRFAGALAATALALVVVGRRRSSLAPS